MNKTIKTIILTAIIMIMISITGCANTNAEEFPQNINNIEIYVDGVAVEFLNGNKPFVDDQNRTQIPVRSLSNFLNKTVEWDGDNWTATIDKEGKNLQIKIGSDTIKTKDGDVKIDTKAVIINGSTYIPLRAVLEIYGLDVDYERIRGIDTIFITTNTDENIDFDIVENEPKNNNENNTFTTEELANFFKSNFREEQYEIKQGLVYFDSQHASLGGDVNAFDYVDSQEIVITNFQNDNRTAVNAILKSMTNEQVSNEIIKQLDDGFGGKGINVNEWTTSGDYQYKFIKRNVGVEVHIEKI
ncbi:hypothetical protein SDC9_50171 [bioreactor metagenome]|uniref:Copper amine oxidase-like N-terminal domain-containing protein n=1 Tax=bioreactor metagenome TaxID=1076179 RepID=A0A644WNT3_9ZZZZ